MANIHEALARPGIEVVGTQTSEIFNGRKGRSRTETRISVVQNPVPGEKPPFKPGDTVRGFERVDERFETTTVVFVSQEAARKAQEPK